ncbi:MAG TPA: hypothetical protein VM529_16945 [Gemmata sp.]|nr:hypothetical protein [Gemmata sp.]
MDHTPHTPPAAPATRIVNPILGGMAGASFGLGFFSAIVFFWYPFGPILATVGLALGMFTLARGVRGPRGENFPLAGVAMCAVSLTVSFTLNHVLRFLQWDKLW